MSGGLEERVNLVFAINISLFSAGMYVPVGWKDFARSGNICLFVCSSDLDFV